MFSFSSKALPFALGLVLVFAACDSNDDRPEPQTVFESLDNNADGAIDYEEYYPLLTSANYRGSSGQSFFSFFSEDDTFSEAEFERIVRLTFDSQDDGIDEDEFETGAAFFFGDDNDQVFADYDADESGVIEDDGEFADYLAEASPFDNYDTSGNGELSPTELARGLFGALDRDDDGSLGENEFYEGVEMLLKVELTREPVVAALRPEGGSALA